MDSITDYDAPLSASDPAASSGAGVEQTVPITLTTSLDQYAIPSGPYMVPVSWRRTHLSTLVNKLVASSSSDAAATTVPFDFIIDSSLLRTTLGEYLDTQGLTSESTLSIEYVRSTLPPTRLAALEHDDWVGSVDCSYTAGVGSVYMTSAYDGSIRLFSPSNAAEAVHTFSTLNKATVQAGKNGSLTSAKWTPNGDAIVTGGMDGRVQLWNVAQGEDGEWTSGRKWVGEAHNAPISAVDTAQGPSGASVLSVGWDGMVALWDDIPSASTASTSDTVESDSESDEEGASKRRKTANGKSSKPSKSTSKPGTQEPTSILWHAQPSAHTVTGAKNVFTPASRVTAVLFERSFPTRNAKDSNRAWTSGFNGQLKGWDLSSGGLVHTSLSLPSSTSSEIRPIISLAHLAPSTLVAGSMDRGLHIFDSRTSSSSIQTLGIAIPNAHRGPVDVVSAHPFDQHLFASGSGMEATVKVWDSRSSKKALFSLGVQVEPKKGGEKGVLGLHWSNDGQELVAGGKDKRITVYRGSGIGIAQNT
ncbi:hypothetical protein NDA16_002327 [Ustilago loliicola]|nr:hypothetical protein NDA16_002327 [Ustilago loliicola]